MSDKRKGFASLSAAQRRAVSAKGGRFKGRKGTAAMSPEKRREIALKGVEARRKRKEQNEQVQSRTESQDSQPGE